MACEYAARLRAIAKVKTPHFFFLDSDDEYEAMRVPSNTLTVGVEYRKTDEYCLPVMQQTYTPERHIACPQLIHNATCINTQAALRALRVIPDSGEYYFHLMFYYTLAQQGAPVFDDRLRYVWNVHSDGLHTRAAMAVHNTQEYLRNRCDTIKPLHRS
jgi:hypothetical protein